MLLYICAYQISKTRVWFCNKDLGAKWLYLFIICSYLYCIGNQSYGPFLCDRCNCFQFDGELEKKEKISNYSHKYIY